MPEETKSPLDQVRERAAADSGFRDRLMADPKPTMKRDLGIVFPDDVEVVVVQNTLNKFTVVLPVVQPDFDELGEVISFLKGVIYHMDRFGIHAVTPGGPTPRDAGPGDTQPTTP